MQRKPTPHSYRTQPGTQHPTRENIGRRKRPLPHIYVNERLAERFYQILFDEDDRLTVYIYRASEDGCVIKPKLYKCHPFSGLESYIRDNFGGGSYAIYIRQGETMRLAGIISIGVPLK